MEEAVKMNGRGAVIHLTKTDDGKCLASFHSDFIGATYAVVFPESITGAVALHRFARMIENEYGKKTELTIDDEFFPLRSRMVEELLQSIAEKVPVLR